MAIINKPLVWFWWWLWFHMYVNWSDFSQSVYVFQYQSMWRHLFFMCFTLFKLPFYMIFCYLSIKCLSFHFGSVGHASGLKDRSKQSNSLQLRAEDLDWLSYSLKGKFYIYKFIENKKIKVSVKLVISRVHSASHAWTLCKWWQHCWNDFQHLLDYATSNYVNYSPPKQSQWAIF